jgi:hypothetical protein
MEERVALDTSMVPDLAARVQLVKKALVAHYAGVAPAPDQMHTLPDAAIRPCCAQGAAPVNRHGKCFCRNYTPGKAYP